MSSVRLSEDPPGDSKRSDGESLLVLATFASDEESRGQQKTLVLSLEKDIFNHVRLGAGKQFQAAAVLARMLLEWISQEAVAVRNRLSIFELTRFSIAAKDARLPAFLPSFSRFSRLRFRKCYPRRVSFLLPMPTDYLVFLFGLLGCQNSSTPLVRNPISILTFTSLGEQLYNVTPCNCS